MSARVCLKINKSSVLFALLGLFLSTTSSAYFSTVDTADVVKTGEFKTSLAPQFIITKRDGVNLVGRVDTGINDDSSVRGLIGFGTVDFQAGAFYKWAPIPDVENQPGMAIMAGVLLGRDKSENELSLRLHPIVSKKFDSDFGLFTPFASLPVGMTTYDGETEYPVQVAVGSELRVHNLKQVAFVAELGFNVSKAFSYITLGASVYLDQEQGLKEAP